jgi:hypothetical protein
MAIAAIVGKADEYDTATKEGVNMIPRLEACKTTIAM